MNKHLIAFLKDIFKPRSIKNGERFEDETQDYWFPEEHYRLINKTHDVNTNSKRYVESSLAPDFEFVIRNAHIKFHVECKYKDNATNRNTLDVFKPGQLTRYKGYRNTFIFLCTYINDNRCYYFIPVWHIKYDNLYISALKNYEVTMEPPILPALIMKFVKD